MWSHHRDLKRSKTPLSLLTADVCRTALNNDLRFLEPIKNETVRKTTGSLNGHQPGGGRTKTSKQDRAIGRCTCGCMNSDRATLPCTRARARGHVAEQSASTCTPPAHGQPVHAVTWLVVVSGRRGPQSCPGGRAPPPGRPETPVTHKKVAQVTATAGLARDTDAGGA